MQNSSLHTLYLSLGANIGRRKTALRHAIAQINERVGVVDRQSSFHETQPWGFESKHAFINACVRCRTELSPHEVLFQLKEIEKTMGRTHKSVDGVYQDRPIDIDILLYDDLIIDEPQLKIPHPLMQQRDFVMVPLREILDQ